MISSHKVKGKAWKFGDNIDTDQIIPAKYCNTFDPEMLSPHVMEGADVEFARKVAPGDFIVAGRNFGCGSSREAAPIAIKGAGIQAVIAESFARLFYRNSVNIGLPVLISPLASKDIKQGDEIEIDISVGTIRVLSTGNVYSSRFLGGIIKEIIEVGGMVEYIKQKLGIEH